jgi:2,3-bisphosphoglycerate-independent phosphoglycerate mutase
MNAIKPVVLVVLDGYGISPITQGNAIAQARKPTFDYLEKHYPTISLQASGIAVGLPWGETGNSETGHLNMGSGMVVYQNLPLISLAIQNGTFFQNPSFLQAIEHVREHGSRLHLLGMISPGGVHSHSDHVYALIELARQQGLEDVFVHAITDGRDTERDLALRVFNDFEKRNQDGIAKIATISGRFYAMDRNENWNRTKQFYDAMIVGEGPRVGSAVEMIEKSYKDNVFDEHLVPTILTRDGADLPRVQDNDAVIFFNFRPDRARQITKSIILPQFAKFNRDKSVRTFFVSMTDYEDDLPLQVAFKPQRIKNPLSRILSDYGLHQLHLAETEKYAHVTYFFNGGRENPFPNEEFILIPSKDVMSYADAPEMSAIEITDKIIERVQGGQYDFVLANYANADMVGHTGDINATIRGVETLDAQIKRLYDQIVPMGGVLIITGDHGNAEEMINPQTGRIDKEHNSGPVPFILIHSTLKRDTPEPNTIARLLTPIGILADVAPTVLHIFGIEQPPEMTGTSLLDIMGITQFSAQPQGDPLHPPN